jgi:hypothetical protein
MDHVKSGRSTHEAFLGQPYHEDGDDEHHSGAERHLKDVDVAALQPEAQRHVQGIYDLSHPVTS